MWFSKCIAKIAEVYQARHVTCDECDDGDDVDVENDDVDDDNVEEDVENNEQNLPPRPVCRLFTLAAGEHQVTEL